MTSDPAAGIIVLGAGGRMGQMVLEACFESGLRVVGAVESKGSPHVGTAVEAGGKSLVITEDVREVSGENNVWIDFTVPEATLDYLDAALEQKAKLVIGTTGFTDLQKQNIEQGAQTIPIVLSPNMSVGVNALFKITELVSRVLGEAFDVEITEAHHRMKKDAPSGTAIGLAEAVGRGRDMDYKQSAVYGRKGNTGERTRQEVGIHALRGGSIVGDHTVLYAGSSERIELKHIAESRMIFAQGAVKAAQFLFRKSKGLYSMFDVLGLDKL